MIEIMIFGSIVDLALPVIVALAENPWLPLAGSTVAQLGVCLTTAFMIFTVVGWFKKPPGDK